jgi:hypothetical protein
MMPVSLYTSIAVAMSGALRATHLRAIIIRIVLTILHFQLLLMLGQLHLQGDVKVFLLNCAIL